jgi:hypothetical protein
MKTDRMTLFHAHGECCEHLRDAQEAGAAVPPSSPALAVDTAEGRQLARLDQPFVKQFADCFSRERDVKSCMGRSARFAR